MASETTERLRDELKQAIAWALGEDQALGSGVQARATLAWYRDEILNSSSSFLLDVARELSKAEAKHAPMNSGHEAYAVILEEVEEFWDEVKAQTLDKAKARKELVQVATMAFRAVRDLKLESVE